MDTLKINDMNLQGKFIIDDRAVEHYFPTKAILEKKSLRVMINNSLPVWVMTTHSGEQWFYVPFTHEVRKAENIRFGRIYFNRSARYLRDEYTHKGCIKKVFSVYLCTRKTMFLIKEVKEYWPQDLPIDLEGSSCDKVKWFGAFRSSAEAEEYNKDDPY